MLKTAFLIAAVLIILPGLAHAAAAQAGAPDVRGAVSQVERKGADGPGGVLVGTLLIEGIKEADTRVDKALVRVSAETAIYDLRAGDSCELSVDVIEAAQPAR